MSTKMKLELLPNEIFIECFQYLNAPDIFHSFDQLNSRFYTLIRSISLHVSFQHFKKSSFNEFCQTILSNPEIKEKIISLQLSNDGTFGQTASFLSLFSLNEFIHLRSLSLIEPNVDNAKQVLPILPLLSNLTYFSCTGSIIRCIKVIRAFLKLKIQKMIVPNIRFSSKCIYETMAVTSLTLHHGYLSDLDKLMKFTPMLKYLTIEDFHKSRTMDDELNFTNINLKQLIINSCSAEFQTLELFLKRIPNLKIFSIYAPVVTEMIEADRWQHLIETSLLHLDIFKFNFWYHANNSSNEKLLKFQKFQTDFWHKQHQWYTNYEIYGYSSTIYTIPYLLDSYTLRSTMNRCSNSHEFDNVKELYLETTAIKDDSSHYFRNAQSLILEGGFDENRQRSEYELTVTQLEFLHRIVNLSNITSLTIKYDSHITSTVLLEILKKTSNLSSLSIETNILIPLLKNRQLCKYLNTKIKTLNIASNAGHRDIKPHQLNLLCKTFSNIEQLYCNIQKLDDLLLILTKCSKLSIIKFKRISKDLCSWVQINRSSLNIYFDDIISEDDEEENVKYLNR